MPLRVRIGNLNKKRKINQKAIKKIAVSLLRAFKKKNALIDITFVNNKRIKMLNKKYMRRNTPTDVISFLLEEKLFLQRKALIGDIYISSDMAYNNTRRFNTNFQKELRRYVIHGLLHLVGFNDRTLKEKNKIRRLEEKFLKKLWPGGKS